MTDSPISGSEPARPSQAFERLHPKLQRWVYEEGWTTLHDAQERAIPAILGGARDVIISAATSAGKTEAAFLPICSVLAAQRDAPRPAPIADPWENHDPWMPPSTSEAVGVEVLYISPLKALINDQFDRLDQLCGRAGIPVHRWHGDVSQTAKHKLLDDPSGVLLITPESLEATFVNRGADVPVLFAGLRYVVVDELHTFLGTPRGAQLQSLLTRVELAIRRRPPRIGLSATLGDMSMAAAFLRPTTPANVLVVASTSDHQDLKLQVRGYRHAAPELTGRHAATAETVGLILETDDAVDADRLAVTDHLFRTLRNSDNLIFANARGTVEAYSDLLARRCERERIPNEFWPHHGSLAKDVREVVESQLKDHTRPVTAVCTSTLEMGIDIGSVANIAQIGPPPSVAALRQRLGRSGRRDEPAVIRIYVTEDDLSTRSSLQDELRCGLMRTIAMVRMMLDRWVESPDDPGLNLSTLIQQVLSVIAQHGGARANEIHRALCGPGCFAQVDPERFTRLLRAMTRAELLTQAVDGTLLHGPTGDRIVNHYSFYAAFQSPKEWRLVAGSKTLGSIPIAQPLHIGGLLIFAGRRWKIAGIDSDTHVIELSRAAGGKPPRFGGSSALVGDRVREEMADVLKGDDIPEWLDQNARLLLSEARQAWQRYRLDDNILIRKGNDTIVLPWVGDRALVTASLALTQVGLAVSADGPTLAATQCEPGQLIAAAAALIDGPAPDPVAIARGLQNTDLDKWDWVLDADLAAESTAARLLDTDGAWRVLHAVAKAPLAPQSS